MPLAPTSHSHPAGPCVDPVWIVTKSTAWGWLDAYHSQRARRGRDDKQISEGAGKGGKAGHATSDPRTGGTQ